MDCTFVGTAQLTAEGALAAAGTGHGMFTASKVVLNRSGEGELCPESAKLDALYEPLEHLYIVG